MRAAYTSKIRSEKKLLSVLITSANAKTEPLKSALLNKITEGKILEVCNYFGIINYSAPLKN